VYHTAKDILLSAKRPFSGRSTNGDATYCTIAEEKIDYPRMTTAPIEEICIRSCARKIIWSLDKSICTSASMSRHARAYPLLVWTTISGKYNVLSPPGRGWSEAFCLQTVHSNSGYALARIPFWSGHRVWKLLFFLLLLFWFTFTEDIYTVNGDACFSKVPRPLGEGTTRDGICRLDFMLIAAHHQGLR